MKQLLTWLLRNRKTVIAGVSLAVEYMPKAYQYARNKWQTWREKRNTNKAKNGKRN